MCVVKQALVTGILACLVAVSAEAQTPTYSIEAVAVNSTPVPGRPVDRIDVAPGDALTVVVYVRDWSPNGEKLRSYQATIDSTTFTSGTTGSIRPIGADDEGDNAANVFVDEADPSYVHKDLHTIPLTQTATLDYAWITVLFDGEEGPISAQDGTKRSCGTLNLRVSDDARGTFTLSLAVDRGKSLIVDPNNVRIEPLEFESLTVNVRDPAQWLRIDSSDPPDQAIDARRIDAPSGSAARSAWNSIQLAATGDASVLTPDDFTIDDGTSDPPRIIRITSDGSRATLRFDRGIRPGVWTTVTHKASGSTTRIGCLPGDVNNDGQADARDVHALIEALNGARTLPVFSTDIDGDGMMTARDLARLIDLLAAPSVSRSKLVLKRGR